MGVGPGVHATRLTDPAMGIEDLPPVDLVLLSHYHGDHFDHVAQEHLDRGTPIVTTPQAQRQLAELGFTHALGLETWDAVSVTSRGGTRRSTSASSTSAARRCWASSCGWTRTGLEALNLIDPGTVVPVHPADYDVSTSPLEDFLAATEGAFLRAKVRPLAQGETWELPPTGTPAGLSG